MGVFRVRVQIFALDKPDRREDLEVVVDTGAARTVVPRPVAERLGIRAESRQSFRMVNGQTISRELAWIGLSLDGDSVHTRAIVGDVGDTPALGALTLEELALEVDSTRSRLRPSEQLLLLAA